MLVLLSICAFLGSSNFEDQSWLFSPSLMGEGFAENTKTLPVQASPDSMFAPNERGGGLILNQSDDALVIAERVGAVLDVLPKEAFSIEAWVSIEQPQRWGSILCAVQDDGDVERGFILGFNEKTFSFALATEGADDGDGLLTYLDGKTPYEPGAWSHVVATYDGEAMKLYVDGELDAVSNVQSGSLLYPLDSPLVLGCYRDSNESFPLDGRLHSVRMTSTCLQPDAIEAAFHSRRFLCDFKAWTDTIFEFLVSPYLTWPTMDSVSILFETTFPSLATVSYRRDRDTEEETQCHECSDSASLHEVRLTGLDSDQKYFYQVVIKGPEGEEIESPLLSFRTASSVDKSYTFVVIGDTQTHGEVAKRVSDLAWMHRPNFVVHAGDLVDTGSNKRDWTEVFFPSMQPLISRVPLMPVLGNHEQDAPHYYSYMSLPEPERWYSFRYGNAEFFMIDGNRSLADQSDQLRWLEKALESSTALWRFAVLHQPPYTSDADDYGDTWKEGSYRGDRNVRNIVKSLEAHGIDICFSGHVHDYERTFPIRNDEVKAYEEGGVIYVTAAGGGGNLEDFDPSNTWFGHKKARYHHLVYIGIHGENLEFQAIDEHGRLFDTLQLKKRGK